MAVASALTSTAAPVVAPAVNPPAGVVTGVPVMSPAQLQSVNTVLVKQAQATNTKYTPSAQAPQSSGVRVLPRVSVLSAGPVLQRDWRFWGLGAALFIAAVYLAKRG